MRKRKFEFKERNEQRQQPHIHTCIYIHKYYTARKQQQKRINIHIIYVSAFMYYKEKQLTRRASIGNTKSVADKTILFGPFDKRFFSK